MCRLTHVCFDTVRLALALWRNKTNENERVLNVVHRASAHRSGFGLVSVPNGVTAVAPATLRRLFVLYELASRKVATSTPPATAAIVCDTKRFQWNACHFIGEGELDFLLNFDETAVTGTE